LPGGWLAQSHQKVQVGALTRLAVIRGMSRSPCPAHSSQNAKCSAAMACAASAVRSGLSTSSRIWAPGPKLSSLAPNLVSQERRTAGIGSRGWN